MFELNATSSWHIRKLTISHIWKWSKFRALTETDNSKNHALNSFIAADRYTAIPYNI